MSAITSEPVRNNVLAQATSKIRTQFSPGTALVILIGIALAYWLWFGLTQRSTIGDEALSVLAVQGIVDRGLPFLPSGYIYHRGYVPNYLMAASVQVFGFNLFALILPSLIMAAGSLAFVYFFAKDVFGRPIVGLLAVVILILLQTQTFYATSPRMYMALQFFTIAASYCAWRGYIVGDLRFKWLTFLTIGLAFLSQRQGGLLLAVIPVALMAIMLLKGRERARVNLPAALISLVVLSGIYIYILPLFHELPLNTPAVGVLHGGVDPQRLGLHFDIGIWLKQIFNLERILPFGIWFAPVAIFLAYGALREKHDQANQGIAYALLLFAGIFLAVILLVRSIDIRFWFMGLPIYALLVSICIATLAEYFSKFRNGLTFVRQMKFLALPLVFVAWSITIFLISVWAYTPSGYVNLFTRGFGLPCQKDLSCSKHLKEQYLAIKPQIAGTDFVVSSNPTATGFHLGKVDGYLRERRVGSGFAAFTLEEDPQTGTQMIDSFDELLQLQASERRVWIFTDDKVLVFSSPQTIALVEDKYQKFQETDYLTVYGNFENPAR